MKTHTHSRPSRISNDADFNDRFWYWQGASGRSYIHSVYPADACPPLPGASFIAVRRTADGACVALKAGRFGESSQFTSQSSAVSGADEVHVHMLARSWRDSERVLDDLNEALFELEPAPERAVTRLATHGAACGANAQLDGFQEQQIALFADGPLQPVSAAA